MDLKLGDLKPHLSAVLNGGPEDWTGATVQISIKKPDGTVSIHNAVIDTATKTVEYDWTGFVVDQLGTHLYEWIVTFQDGDPMTAPPEGHLGFKINGRL